MRIAAQDAQRVIDENPELPGPERTYFQAIVDNALPPYYFERFADYRYNYSDDLPGIGLDSNNPLYADLRFQALLDHPSNPRMKCRMSIIKVAIGLTLEDSVSNEVVPDELVKPYRERSWAGAGPKWQQWTTPEDILFVNSTLDSVLRYLKTSYCLDSSPDNTKF